MIRLDGNSLAAFRGAGVAGTVQSVAGCELFGAARSPKWASPYSAAATRALKAQFPTQWPTIRDYGFAHPEIVGYMNAYAPEDAKIAYSLVPTLGVRRYLVGDGKVWFETGITTEYTKMSFEVGAALTRALSGEYEMFGNYSGSNQGITAGHYNTNRVFMYASGGNSNVVVSDLQAYHLYKFVIDANNGIFSTECDGTVANISKAYNLYARNATIKFMDGQTFNLNKGFYKFTHFDMTYGDNGHKHYIPFLHKDGNDTIPCMLELISGVIEYNQGTGDPTISESPA